MTKQQWMGLLGAALLAASLTLAGLVSVLWIHERRLDRLDTIIEGVFSGGNQMERR
jgi:hypothetical protein